MIGSFKTSRKAGFFIPQVSIQCYDKGDFLGELKIGKKKIND